MSWVSEPAVAVVVVDIIFTTLAFITVCFRLFTRTVLVKNVGSDDYYIAGSMAASIAYLTVIMIQIKAGLGRHLKSLDEVVGFLYALWATIWIYSLALMFVKMSITVQCYRVFRTPSMQKFFKIYFVLVVIYGLWTVFGTFFTCWPINLWWEAVRGPQAPRGMCMDKNIITFVNAGINILSDLVLAIVPIPLLWKLQIPRRQKIVLTSLFGLGTFASVMSIVRLFSLKQIASAPDVEQSVMGVSIAIWSCIEVNIAIMCASAPALKPLIIKVFPKMLLSDLYAKTKGAYYASKSKFPGGSGSGKHGDGNKSAGGSSSESGNRSRVRTHTRSAHSIGGSAMRSGNHDRGNHIRPGEIQVEHEIEMKSVPISEVMGHEPSLGHNRGSGLNAGTRSEEDISNAGLGLGGGRISPAGSERNLVWSQQQQQNDDMGATPYYGQGQPQGISGMGMGMGMGMGPMGIPGMGGMNGKKNVTTITTCQATHGPSSSREQQQAREREMV
ncbi:hypothetical protein B0T20DRAFT_4571 [Sordaria brevicollis]|uniref:Rhodopsin domain-containing protein n=1 Tax=Sordaria brevicollis TaxID=83679 RepID=A0AAE0UG75_SORBR|nr:hypothetical protein B0T20DRAFT_4571 [Sordaria brevicollis]